MDNVQLIMQICIFAMLTAAYFLLDNYRLSTKWKRITHVAFLYGVTLLFFFTRFIEAITWFIIVGGIMLFNILKSYRNERRIKGFNS
jgi:hypothetical protein